MHYLSTNACCVLPVCSDVDGLLLLLPLLRLPHMSTNSRVLPLRAALLVCFQTREFDAAEAKRASVWFSRALVTNNATLRKQVRDRAEGNNGGLRRWSGGNFVGVLNHSAVP